MQSQVLKLSATAVLLMAAAGVWYWSGRTDREARRSAAQALAGVVYRVQCGACKESFEVPAAKYVEQIGREGVKCKRCGERKAWRIGDASDVDPGSFRDEFAKLASVGDVKAASDSIQRELSQVTQDLAAANERADAAEGERLRKQHAVLRAKAQAIDQRWDELVSK